MNPFTQNDLFDKTRSGKGPPPPSLAPAEQWSLGREQDAVEVADFALPLMRKMGIAVDVERLREICFGFSESEDMTWFVYRQKGQVRGVILVSLRQMFATKPQAYIDGWLVDPKIRGQGKGTALLEMARTWARQCGAESLALAVTLESMAKVPNQWNLVDLVFVTEIGKE